MARTQKLKARTKQHSLAGPTGTRKPLIYFSLACILTITFVAFQPVLKNGFTNWDDPDYVLENNLVKSLSGENLKTIFTEQVMGNYHPFTILSLAMDYKLYKMTPRGYHLTNLLIHLLNVLLLYFLVLRLTGSSGSAGIAALLFGIHPMHVESVAWIAERKDVGYVFFYMATLLLYLEYIKHQNKKIWLYILMIGSFVAALLFKGLAVTLPVVLVLIDHYKDRNIRKTWKEKIPFFVLAILFGMVAILAQKESNSIQDIKLYSYFERVLFACYALTGYLWKFFLPLHLSAFYPYPDKTGTFYPWLVYVSPAIVLAAAFLLFRLSKVSRDILFGSLFFILNIVLVLQLLPVGNAVMADRYSYLAYAGLFLIAGSLLQKYFFDKEAFFKKFRLLAGTLFAGYLLFCVLSTHARTGVWHDSGKLFTDVIQKYPRVPIAYNNLGSYYQKQELLDQALVNFNQAILLQPDFADALINRSDIYRVHGNLDAAIKDCSHAIRINPALPSAYMNRGIAYSIMNEQDSAMNDFNKVILLAPNDARAYGNRGNLYDMKGQTELAIADYNHSLLLDPAYQDVYGNRARSFLRIGKNDEAILDLKNAVNYFPYNPENYFLLAVAYQEKKEWKLALENVLMAKSLGKNVDQSAIDVLESRVNPTGE